MEGYKGRTPNKRENLMAVGINPEPSGTADPARFIFVTDTDHERMQSRGFGRVRNHDWVGA